MFNIFKPKIKSKKIPNKKRRSHVKATFTTYDREKTSMMHLLTRFYGVYSEEEELPHFFENSDILFKNNGYEFNLGIKEYDHKQGIKLLEIIITTSDCISKNFFPIIVIAFPINDLNWFNKTRDLFKKSIFQEKNMILVGTHLEYRLDPKYKKKLIIFDDVKFLAEKIGFFSYIEVSSQ
jgi:hypothetical protein